MSTTTLPTQSTHITDSARRRMASGIDDIDGVVALGVFAAMAFLGVICGLYIVQSRYMPTSLPKSQVALSVLTGTVGE